MADVTVRTVYPDGREETSTTRHTGLTADQLRTRYAREASPIGDSYVRGRWLHDDWGCTDHRPCTRVTDYITIHDDTDQRAA